MATIALSSGASQITIEPGGQLELAGPPVAKDAEFAELLASYAKVLRQISAEHGIAWLRAGFRPWGARGDVPWMPKARYAVMRDYMPKVGSRGLDMMLRTATVQVNLDFSDEQDAAEKMRCAFSIAPVLTALYANSSVVEGRAGGFASVRAHIWRDTDRARTGLLPFVFERDDIFTAYAEWALDVPMYFIYRGGYRDVGNMSFRRFMAEGHGGERATQADWALHLSTLFPETRLKKYIEIRSCDCGSLPMIAALAPLARGLLYDAGARKAATALLAPLTLAQRDALLDDVAVQGLATKLPHRSGTLHDVARDLLAIARTGLAALDASAVGLLWPLEGIVQSGKTQADFQLGVFATTGEYEDLVRKLEHPELSPL
ncbi:MAG: glutamate--cysteine ligase [Myxococcales bacterium]|nr:glutamate--cysteine ligase [Myxococcales bacterium]